MSSVYSKNKPIIEIKEDLDDILEYPSNFGGIRTGLLNFDKNTANQSVEYFEFYFGGYRTVVPKMVGRLIYEEKNKTTIEVDYIYSTSGLIVQVLFVAFCAINYFVGITNIHEWFYSSFLGMTVYFLLAFSIPILCNSIYFYLFNKLTDDMEIYCDQEFNCHQND